MAVNVTETLRQTRLLGALPDADLASLARAARTRAFRRGQVVCMAGDPGDTLMVMLSGRAKVVLHSADGGELILMTVGPGGTLGEVSVADGGPRSADVEVLADSQLLLIPRELIQQVCAQVPAAAQALADSVASTLRRLTDATSDLVFLDLPRRVAKALLSLPRDQDGVIRPPLTQEQLASHVASTRQSVNAALRGFERRGWIAVTGRTMTIRQPELLASFASG